MDRLNVGRGDGLQASWLPLDEAICGHTRQEDSKAWLMATMGRYSKETVLEAVRSRCERDSTFRDSLFFELMHAPDEEHPECCRLAARGPTNSSAQEVVDLTTIPVNAGSATMSRKRKAKDIGAVSSSDKRQKSHEVQLKPFNCGQCGKLCTGTTDRENGSCLHHEGSLDVDDDGDFWADENESVHGRIDTTKRRCEFPEGFYWTCCGNSGTSRGCVISSHGDVGKSHLARLRAAGFPH